MDIIRFCHNSAGSRTTGRGADECAGSGGPIASPKDALAIHHRCMDRRGEKTGLERRDSQWRTRRRRGLVQVSQRQGRAVFDARGYSARVQGSQPPKILLAAQVLRILVEDGRPEALPTSGWGGKDLKAKRGVVERGRDEHARAADAFRYRPGRTLGERRPVGGCGTAGVGGTCKTTSAPTWSTRSTPPPEGDPKGCGVPFTFCGLRLPDAEREHVDWPCAGVVKSRPGLPGPLQIPLLPLRSISTNKAG